MKSIRKKVVICRLERQVRRLEKRIQKMLVLRGASLALIDQLKGPVEDKPGDIREVEGGTIVVGAPAEVAPIAEHDADQEIGGTVNE
jgi:hypothetical protein